jgi:predicted ATPase
MITSIHFHNFKVLRNTTLPLKPFTLIVGPNGSGKSSAMEAIRFASEPKHRRYEYKQIVTAGQEYTDDNAVEVSVEWLVKGRRITTMSAMSGHGEPFGPSAVDEADPSKNIFRETLQGFRVFSFDPVAIAAEVQTQPQPELGSDGSRLAAVLDSLRDSHYERFEALNLEFVRWFPEFDRIQFETPDVGKKALLLRTKIGRHLHRASDLSQGTLFALAFLTVAYLPTPPPIICFEEPDRGIHPRLLQELRDAMYRLAFPDTYGESKRAPVQIIATTHSPYLLDLYKEHPEEVVIAHKDAQGAHFEALADNPDIIELLEGAPLGEIWFSGILGGVPTAP